MLYVVLVSYCVNVVVVSSSAVAVNVVVRFSLHVVPSRSVVIVVPLCVMLLMALD